jgi:hypothetical protein
MGPHAPRVTLRPASGEDLERLAPLAAHPDVAPFLATDAAARRRPGLVSVAADGPMRWSRDSQEVLATLAIPSPEGH